MFFSHFVKANADVNIQNRITYATPLHNAVALQNLYVVKLLLKHGARILPTKNGYTPLHDAAGLGWEQVFKF